MSVARAFNTRPLYQQVADEFASRLISGEWAPGQTIANEADIARSLGISLGTVRKAFDILVDLDLLERHQGRGTVVPDATAGERRNRFSNFFSGDRRITGTIEIDGPQIAFPTAREAERLEINERTPILTFGRRRRHHGRLFMNETVHLRIPALSGEPSERDLHDLAVRRWTGKEIATVKSEWATPHSADETDAAVFGVEPGTPLLAIERVIRSYQNRPLELRYGRCHLGDDLVYSCR